MSLRFTILFLFTALKSACQTFPQNTPDSLMYSNFKGKIVSQNLSSKGLFELVIKNDSLHESRVICSDTYIKRKQLKAMKNIEYVFFYTTWLNTTKKTKLLMLHEIRYPNY